jgi:hypothetical protein
MPLAQNSRNTKKKTASQGLPNDSRRQFGTSFGERAEFHPSAIYVGFMIDKLAQ